MYKHCDLEDRYISLHDCHAEKINFNDGILSFAFPDGFWVTQQHNQNNSDTAVRTDSAQVDFPIIDGDVDGIEFYVFKDNSREAWEPIEFINAVNGGDFTVEFITPYKSYQSYLFKCWIWFEKAPHHLECEIVLSSENAVYRWNTLRYDCSW